jgi:hypothetical protein
MKTKILIPLLLLLGLVAKAQMPGYMGKRFVAGVDVAMGPVFNIIGQNPFNYDIMFGYAPTVFIDYSINRRNSWGFMYQFSTYKFTHRYNSVYNDPDLWNVNPFDPLPPVYKKAHMSYMSNTFALSWKRYRTQLAAPMGRYTNFDFGVSILSASDIDGVIPREDGIAKKGTYYTNVQPYLAFGFGNQRVLFNTLAVKTHFGFGFYPLLLFKGNSQYINDEEVGYREVGYKVRSLANNTIFMRLTIGFGFIY